MAEGWTTSNVLCRYYVNGVCREGNRCHFSHDRDRTQTNNICRYYLRGCCAYGEQCRYDHVKPRQNGPSATSKLVERNGLSLGEAPSLPVTSTPISSSPSNSVNTKLSCGFMKSAPKLSPLIDTNSKPLGRMTVLHKQGQSSDSGIGDEINTSLSSSLASLSKPSTSELWVNAPEFIPSVAIPKSYADAVIPGVHDCSDGAEAKLLSTDGLCPYAMVSDCPFGLKCECLHGDVCDMCGYACLHPTDEAQRKKHTQECMQEHERDMELSFAIARSKDKVCGICMDMIMEKIPHSERRFGILPNCCHVFCLSCIRKWRRAKQFDNKLVRACPECRVASDFVIPSKYWVDSKEDKEKLITDYRTALSQKPCKYFKQGRGECPFAGNCFYLHAYPDGRKAELPPPRPRKRHNAEGEYNLMQSVILWDFFEERDSRWLFRFDLEDMLEFFSDSDDDSEWSDYDLWD